MNLLYEHDSVLKIDLNISTVKTIKHLKKCSQRLLYISYNWYIYIVSLLRKSKCQRNSRSNIGLNGMYREFVF